MDTTLWLSLGDEGCGRLAAAWQESKSTMLFVVFCLEYENE